MNDYYINTLDIDLDDPTTYPYYINLIGEYHGADNDIYITDFTLKTRILLNKNTLSQTINRDKYLTDFSLYKDLLAKYSTQKHLIRSIFFPIKYSQIEAIDAPNFTLLGYDESLLNVRERDNIIFDLINFLEYYKYRWYINTFEYEELYPLSSWSILWIILPLFLLTKKIHYTKTGNVDDFHLWEYLISKGLKDYTEYLTSEQNLYFYRNIDFLIGNLGKILVTDSLNKKLLKPIGLKLQSKWVYHDLKDGKENAHWNTISTNKNIYDTDKILRINTFDKLIEDIKTNKLDTDRYPEYEENIKNNFTFNKHNHLITKYQEIITNLKDFKYVQFYTRFVFDIVFNLYKNDRIDYNINIINDVDSGNMLSIDIYDAINLLYYSYYKKNKETPIYLPTLYTSMIGINVLERPTLQDEYLYGNEPFKISNYVDINDILDMITYIEGSYKFEDKDSLSDFINLRYDLWIQLMILKRNSYSRFKKYAISNLINQISFQETFEINPNLDVYEDYFTLKPYIKEFIDKYENNTSLYDNLIYHIFNNFVNVHKDIQNYLIPSRQKNLYFDKMKQLFIRFNSYLIRLLDNNLMQQEYISLPTITTSLGEVNTLIEDSWNYPSKGILTKISDSEITVLPLVINDFLWSDDNHEENGSYDLTIDATDPNSEDLTYEVECDDSNVTIVQDGIDNHIFHITYPEYTEDTTITYTITVTNESLLTDIETDIKIVANVPANPVINSLVWNDDNHEENGSYDLTVNATDPNSQDLTYEVKCDDSNIIIVQDGMDETLFHITYPEYTEDTTVTYTITVINEDLLTDVEIDVKVVANVPANPVINSLIWNNENHEENETYDLTVNATDPNNEDLTYEVECDEPGVIIVQDGTDETLFHITYPEYTEDTTVTYTITVTNESLLTDVETDIKIVADINGMTMPPEIMSLNWDYDIHYTGNSYQLFVDASDPQGQDLTYEMECDNLDVNIDHYDPGDPNFYVTYPEWMTETMVTYYITVTNEDSLIDNEDIWMDVYDGGGV